MENTELHYAHPTGFVEKKEVPVRKAEDVIRFLREFHFGSPNESARVAVERVIHFIEKRHLIKERLLPGEPRFLDLLIEELDKAEFLMQGTISHKKWTKRAEQALMIALKNFESHSKEWQEKVSRTHPDNRP